MLPSKSRLTDDCEVEEVHFLRLRRHLTFVAARVARLDVSAERKRGGKLKNNIFLGCMVDTSPFHPGRKLRKTALENVLV